MNPEPVATLHAEVQPDVRERLVESLRRDGIGIVRVEELFGKELWQAAREDAEPFLAEAEANAPKKDRPKGKDHFIRRRFDPPRVKGEEEPPLPTLSLESPLLRIGASDAILDVVNAYRGLDTLLYYADTWYTVAYPAAPERVASQQWHRDPEDEHVVKTFLYLSDVDEGAGPFQYVRGSAPGGRYRELWPWGGGKRYPPAHKLERRVDPDDIATLTGPAGTFIVCDTSGFHRGGFARTRPRSLATWTYVSPNAKKRERRFHVDFGGRERELSPQARFALGS